MATAFKNMLHPLHHHRDKKEPPHSGPLHDRTDSAMDKPREQEKQQLAQWEAQKHTLTPEEIDIDPQKKPVGHSSKVLREEDFELIKTLGTGTFARVWLVRLKDAKPGDENKVFALKILRKVDGMHAPQQVTTALPLTASSQSSVLSKSSTSGTSAMSSQRSPATPS